MFFFQAEDGIRDLVRSRGLGDVYKRQEQDLTAWAGLWGVSFAVNLTPDSATGTGAWTPELFIKILRSGKFMGCLLYTSDAADERSSVDLGGRRIIKKKRTSRTGRR